MEGENRKLLIFFDGTSNKFGINKTNVVKSYRVTSSKNQIKCYIPGIGSLNDKKSYFFINRFFRKIMSLFFGYGLQEKVIVAYIFLCNNYKEGDEIYLFGFSRGAYTAKVLSGLIHTCGFMSINNEYLIQYAYNLYSKRKVNFENLRNFKKTFSQCTPTIHFMGLWDSVSSVGNLIHFRNLPFTTNVKGVNVIRHAIAKDENRSIYINNITNGGEDNIQMWFPGIHSDVGGGFPEAESGLSKIPLNWILTEAISFGLEVDTKAYERYILGKNNNKYAKLNSKGIKHKNSILWVILNLIPRLKITFKKYNEGPKVVKEYSFYWPIINHREILKNHKEYAIVHNQNNT